MNGGKDMAIKIFIDQGHNPYGPNTGAVGNGVVEQDVNYEVGIFLRNLLENDYRFEVLVSRPTPDTVLGTSNSTSLQARVNAANNWGADYFLSIHTNSNPNPEINGTEVYVYMENTPAYNMAQDVLNGIVNYVGTKNNGVRINRTFYVLRKTRMPALLIELGYLSNTSDAEKLLNDKYDFAYGIYMGILNYFGYQPL